MRFISNFRYNLKEKLSKDPLHTNVKTFEDLEVGEYHKFNSICNETMIGFVQQVNGSDNLKKLRVQCFHGKQT